MTRPGSASEPRESASEPSGSASEPSGSRPGRDPGYAGSRRKRPAREPLLGAAERSERSERRGRRAAPKDAFAAAERRPGGGLSYDRKIPLLALLAGAPGVAVALWLVWSGGLSERLQWTLTLLLVGCWLGGVAALRERLIRPLQTMSNMLAALHVGDYSMRARLGEPEDSLGLVAHEVNSLGATLREQRLEVLEATALLRRVMAEIEVAILAFDEEDRLVLANRAAEGLLRRSEESMRGRSARALGLGTLLEGEAPRVVDLALPAGIGRWEVRRSTFRQDGRPHRLLVLSDLSRVLREEERKAWQRLVRVLSHEINNSLAPIRSIAGSLRTALRREGRGEEPDAAWIEDAREGLDVIAGRSEALSRFMSAYARLARLPTPERGPVEVAEWVGRVARLEARAPVQIEGGPPITIMADGDQLDQLLINLLDNAIDAVAGTDGEVRVGWRADPDQLEVWVEDEGPGLPDSGNLFVPFFTTKPDGSGIGLALSRQIAEGHGGTLTLSDRDGERGCVARLRLPRS